MQHTKLNQMKPNFSSKADYACQHLTTGSRRMTNTEQQLSGVATRE